MSNVQPTVTGTLSKTPLLHVLASLLEQAASGTLVIETPDGLKTALYLEHGVPSKMRLGAAAVRLSDTLIELGWLRREVAEATFEAAVRSGKLHGAVLVDEGHLEASELEPALRSQLVKKLQWAATRPAGTAFGFYESMDYLSKWRSGPTPVGPLVALWTLARTCAEPAVVASVIARVSGYPLRLHQRSQPRSFGFSRVELTMLDVLRARPQSMDAMLRMGLVSPHVLERIVYVLTLTRHLDFGRGLPPLGIDAVPERDEALLSPKESLRPSRPLVMTAGPMTAGSNPEAQRLAGLSSAITTTAEPVAARERLASSSDARVTPTEPRLANPPPPPAGEGATSDLAALLEAPVGPVRPPVTPAASVRPPSGTSRAVKPGPTPGPTRPPSSASRMNLSAATVETGLPPSAARSHSSPSMASMRPNIGPATTTNERRTQVEKLAVSIGQMNHFEALGLPRDAATTAVQEAYLKLAKAYHPDRLPAELADLKPLATKIFARMSEAHQTLTDTSKRANYVEQLNRGTPDDEDEKVRKVLHAAGAFQKAEVLLKKRMLAAAELEANRALEEDPEQADYLALYAWIQACKADSESRLPELCQLLTEAVTRNPNSEKNRYYRVQVYKRLGQLDRAVADCRIIVEKNPHHVDALREIRLWEMRRSPQRQPPAAATRGTNPQRTTGTRPASDPPAGSQVPGKKSDPPQAPGGLFGRFFKR
jgi:DnaJ-domain-containing protein 1